MIYWPVASVAIHCGAEPALQVRATVVTPLKAHWLCIYITQIVLMVNFVLDESFTNFYQLVALAT